MATTCSKTCAIGSTTYWRPGIGRRLGRVQRPVLIFGTLDGILTGIRQLRRTRPLETEIVAGLRVPTLAEMARVKAWLLATRHTVRDYLDNVVLFERLGESRVVVSAVHVHDKDLAIGIHVLPGNEVPSSGENDP